jgi:hypothetical protein
VSTHSVQVQSTTEFYGPAALLNRLFSPACAAVHGHGPRRTGSEAEAVRFHSRRGKSTAAAARFLGAPAPESTSHSRAASSSCTRSSSALRRPSMLRRAFPYASPTRTCRVLSALGSVAAAEALHARCHPPPRPRGRPLRRLLAHQRLRPHGPPGMIGGGWVGSYTGLRPWLLNAQAAQGDTT